MIPLSRIASIQDFKNLYKLSIPIYKIDYSKSKQDPIKKTLSDSLLRNKELS